MFTNAVLNRSNSETRIAVSEMPSISNGAVESTVSTTYVGQFSGSTLEGLTTGGVPTRTTPTLTPTLLKNIEESFMELQCPPAPHQHQAGFVPPLIHNFSLKEEPQDWLGGLSPASTSSTSSSPALAPPSKSNRGGRRPSRIEKLTPEEEERRRVRRERNKLAAARCRKRRLDHTNLLLHETEDLEEQRRKLEQQISYLSNQKADLEYLLDSHKTICKFPPASSASLLRPYDFQDSLNSSQDVKPPKLVSL